MSPFSKWKTIGYAVAIFATGGISGGALGVYETKAHLYNPEDKSAIRIRMVEHLKTRLDLTPDQVAKINPIVESAASNLYSIRMKMAQDVKRVFDDAFDKVSPILTPEQLKKLDEIEKERHDMMQNHWHPPGQPGQPGNPQWHGDQDHPHPGPEPSSL